jgi:hypothetical protein
MGGCLSPAPRRSKSLSTSLVDADEQHSPSLTMSSPVGVPGRGAGRGERDRSTTGSPPRGALFSPPADARRVSTGHRRRSSATSTASARADASGAVGLPGNEDDAAFSARYELAVRIGAGASSVCWECVNNSTGEHYAVKVRKFFVDIVRTVNAYADHVEEKGRPSGWRLRERSEGAMQSLSFFAE